jgi:hypothetical protein
LKSLKFYFLRKEKYNQKQIKIKKILLCKFFITSSVKKILFPKENISFEIIEDNINLNLDPCSCQGRRVILSWWMMTGVMGVERVLLYAQ